jgi:hypothetical protein
MYEAASTKGRSRSVVRGAAMRASRSCVGVPLSTRQPARTSHPRPIQDFTGPA